MHSDHLLGLSAHGFHRIFYTDWGDPASERVVICVHGLTRNCRDFDVLAQALAADCRVVCPDVAGRGRSDWLYNKDDYSYPQYMADMNALIARVCASPVAAGWLGKLAQPPDPALRIALAVLGRHVDGRHAGHAARLAPQFADPQTGGKRRRAADPQSVARAHRNLRRQGPAF